MKTTIQAVFENMDAADLAMRKIKTSIPIAQYSFSPTKQDHTPSSSLIAPLYPLTDADRAEQTHGNLLPLSSVDTDPPKGETLLKLTVSDSDENFVYARLINLYGRKIKAEKKD